MGNKNRKHMENVVAGPSVTASVKDEKTNKAIDVMVPTALAELCVKMFRRAKEVYFMPGGIKEHLDALENLQSAPDSLGNSMLEFGKECARVAGNDAARALHLFKGATAYTESQAVQEAIKGGMPKDDASIRNILPTWPSNKATVKQLLEKAAAPSPDAGKFDILSTSTNNTTKKTEPVYGTISAVRKVLAQTRGASRTAITLSGVTEVTPQLEVTFKYLAKVAEGVKGTPALQNELAALVNAAVTVFVRKHVNKEAAPAVAAQEAVVQQPVTEEDKRQAALRGGSKAA